MNIEKMSRYIEPVCENRSGGTAHYNRRRILISLPRVKWLDRQPDYEPWPDLPSPLAPEPEKKQSDQPRHNGGMTVADIAKRINKSPNATSKSLQEARHKLGIGLK